MNDITFLSLSELKEYGESIPKQTFIWGPIVEKSLGIVVGPSKSGKTTFCENLALSIAAEKETFLSFDISQIEGNIALALLEEPLSLRCNRHLELYDTFTENEKEKIDERIKYIGVAPHYLSSKEIWQDFTEKVKELSPSILIIDSLGRLTNKNLIDSDNSSFVMKRLRQLNTELDLTSIVIHHTTKLYDVGFPTMDNIKGSTEIVQECDYAIGIGKVDGTSCFNTIVSRYSETQDKPIKFIRNGKYRLVSSGVFTDHEIRAANDGRFDNSGPNEILKDIEDLLNSSGEDFVRTKDIKDKSRFDKRRVQEYLEKLIDQEKINRISKGIYTVI